MNQFLQYPASCVVLFAFYFSSKTPSICVCLDTGGKRSPGEENATHSSVLAWEIPWTEKLGRLQSMGSQRVWYDWATKHACTHTFTDRNNWSSPGMSCFLSLHQALERVLFSVSGRCFQATDACSVTARTLSIRPVCWWQNAWPAFGWDSGERLNLLLVLLLRPLWIFLLV